ncbi:MAG: BrxE family protein [Pseudomonadota bacterium]
MKIDSAKIVAELRLLVGYLGETNQKNWWGSNFLSPSSKAFLTPPFPRTVLLAQYHGVCEAACLVHDAFIGVGSNYHLYRLPDGVERAAAAVLQEAKFIQQVEAELTSADAALRRLEECADKEVNQSDGPVNVGVYADAKLGSLIQQCAGHYLHAFSAGAKTFPFMREA